MSKRNNSNNNKQQSSSSSGSSTMYTSTYKTVFSVAQTTPQSSPYIFLHLLEQTKKGNVTQKKTSSWIWTTDNTSERHQPACSPTEEGPYMTIELIDMYLYVRTDVWKKWQKNENSTCRRETTRARSRPLLAGSGGASKVRHVHQFSNQRTEWWTSSRRSRAFTAQNLV